MAITKISMAITNQYGYATDCIYQYKKQSHNNIISYQLINAYLQNLAFVDLGAVSKVFKSLEKHATTLRR